MYYIVNTVTLIYNIFYDFFNSSLYSQTKILNYFLFFKISNIKKFKF